MKTDIQDQRFPLSEADLLAYGIEIRSIAPSVDVPFQVWSLFKGEELLRGCFSFQEAFFFGRLYVHDDPCATWSDDMAEWYT